MDFVAIDVETANADMASICQIGIAGFTGGQLVKTWSSLIDPEDWFSGMNIGVHGITPEMVEGQPRLPDVIEHIGSMLNGSICVHHTHFDRVAMNRAFGKYELPLLNTIWLDSARVARRTWEEVSSSGYGLGKLCKMIGYQFKHHDALEDAKAAGQVLLAAMNQSQIGLDDWLRRVERPICFGDDDPHGRAKRVGDPEGALHGEVVVFTGSLEIPRFMAADMAAKVGCNVADSVTKKTTLLVVGDQDVTKLAGHDKSNKHRKAEELIQKGQPIRIMREADFRFLVDEN